MNSAQPTSVASKLRYSLRNMLALMAVVSVCSAVLAPFLRGLSSSQRKMLAVNAAVCLAGLAWGTIEQIHGRVRAEREVGPLLLRTTMQPNRRIVFGYYVELLLYVAMAIPQICVAISIAGEGPGNAHFPYWYLLAPWPIYTHAMRPVIGIWWGIQRDMMEIGERGLIISGYVFKKWKDLRRYHWSPFEPEMLIVVEPFYTWKVRVAPENRERVDAILASHVPCGGEPQSGEISAKKSPERKD